MFCICFLLAEKHIDFCCHLKRGGAEHDSSPAYECVKFILSVKFISNGKKNSF